MRRFISLAFLLLLQIHGARAGTAWIQFRYREAAAAPGAMGYEISRVANASQSRLNTKSVQRIPEQFLCTWKETTGKDQSCRINADNAPQDDSQMQIHFDSVTFVEGEGRFKSGTEYLSATSEWYKIESVVVGLSYGDGDNKIDKENWILKNIAGLQVLIRIRQIDQAVFAYIKC